MNDDTDKFFRKDMADAMFGHINDTLVRIEGKQDNHIKDIKARDEVFFEKIGENKDSIQEVKESVIQVKADAKIAGRTWGLGTGVVGAVFNFISRIFG